MAFMDLDQYLSQPNAPTVAELRRRMIALGYRVKSDAQIRQWRHRYADRLPSPENCVGLERATGGAVSRKTFRDDWHLIWPELAQAEAA
jgi:DNA-binding transcriptional regulator YdaS (Cro superfamily)